MGYFGRALVGPPLCIFDIAVDTFATLLLVAM
jgi:hypothetical protein